ncbi:MULTISPECIES: hypothetical protein [unclassified Knoellia]|uniref:hypothetical protein n=1 Tax=Knoellia altitudinis TaxID=3404795 RepID=UPI00361671C4
MDDAMLWIVGGLALVVVVAALVWVLRHLGDPTTAVSAHDYGTPEVTLAEQNDGGGLTFGRDGGDAVDQTVPRSRLGGAGWRDGEGVPEGTTTDAYAGGSSSWDDESAVAPDPAFEHQVEVDTTEPRPRVDEDVDRERGGHW